MQIINLVVAAAALLLPTIVNQAGYCSGTTCIDSISSWECPKQCPSSQNCVLNRPCT
ncbi:uncharacterized protein CTRU02_207961 [Colletotrichum truncatum]|uniref:Uncharacterized protein n=1 Tax=Colletotrichum truncatum TaxID=5467 RepID=A0ACC3Z2C5_COLTU